MNSPEARERVLNGLADIPYPSTDVEAVKHALKACPAHNRTPLRAAPELARMANIGEMLVKDERDRMGLGSFKALGAAYVIACDAKEAAAADMTRALRGKTYVTASAGNHGLSVAAGAQLFGADAEIHIAETVPESFAERLRKKGARVVRSGADYETSMTAAKETADRQGWQLLSDSSWEGYTQAPHRLMEGYLVLMNEALDDISTRPTHVFLQAGVGGLAASMAALVRHRCGPEPVIIVVEPEAAPALMNSVKAGKSVVTEGPVSNMGRLDCKEPSLIALKGLARDADIFVTISDENASDAMPALAELGLATTPSGGAGIAALLNASPHRDQLKLDEKSRALVILSECADP